MSEAGARLRSQVSLFRNLGQYGEIRRDGPTAPRLAQLFNLRLAFAHLSPDANGVSSYQPGATPQENAQISSGRAPTARFISLRPGIGAGISWAECWGAFALHFGFAPAGYHTYSNPIHY